jgi:glycosyltransferase domain-containing protein
VVVVDSSKIPYPKELPLNFSYYHKPDLTFADKVLFGLTMIKSDVVAMSADDDFLINSSLMKAAEMMFNDNSISLSFGSYIAFDESTNNNFSYLPMLNFQKKYFLSNKSKQKKIRHFMKNYDQVLWSMYRKDVIETAFNLIKKSKFKNDNFIEVCIASIAINNGKLNILKDIWGFREQSIDEHWGLRHDAISIADSGDIKKFIEYVSELSSKEYAKDAISTYIKYSFFRRIKVKVIKIIENFFSSKSKLKKRALKIKKYLSL